MCGVTTGTSPSLDSGMELRDSNAAAMIGKLVGNGD